MKVGETPGNGEESPSFGEEPNIIDAMSKDAVYLLIELVKHQGART